MKNIKKATKILAIIVVPALVMALFMWLVSDPKTINKFNLSEIDNGVYVTKYRVSSNVPANNYDVADYCVNNNLYTIKGNVVIKFTDDTPYVIIERSKFVYEDTATFYIPKDGLEMYNSVGIGRK